ncbi:MAG: hypothetical protein EPO19_11045, partial [Betaproteobacteria bacterium]
MVLVLWYWEVRNPNTGRWRKTRYRMTAQDARERFGSDARKLEWSREIRSGDPDANSTRKLPRFVDTRQVEFSGRMSNRLTGGSDEEVEVHGAADFVG